MDDYPTSATGADIASSAGHRRVSQTISDNPDNGRCIMGGMNSGRRGWKATVEGCRTLKLDVNQVTRGARADLRAHKEAAEALIERRVWSWTSEGDAEPRARALVTLVLHAHCGTARLQFDIAQPTHRTGQRDQTVRLESTPCRFGGVRWWWVCPATGRRCATLYLPNGGDLFLSRGRGAYRLAYASQNEGPMDRSHGRLRRLYRLLGDAYTYFEQPLPRRPKWMRQHTYDRLWTDWEAAMERHDAVWMAGAERILARDARDVLKKAKRLHPEPGGIH